MCDFFIPSPLSTFPQPHLSSCITYPRVHRGLFFYSAVYLFMCSDLEKKCSIIIDHTIENSEIIIDRDGSIPFEWWIEWWSRSDGCFGFSRKKSRVSFTRDIVSRESFERVRSNWGLYTIFMTIWVNVQIQYQDR